MELLLQAFHLHLQLDVLRQTTTKLPFVSPGNMNHVCYILLNSGGTYTLLVALVVRLYVGGQTFPGFQHQKEHLGSCFLE